MAGGLDPALAPMASPSQPVPLSTVENRSSSARFSPTRHANGTCVPSRVEFAARRHARKRRWAPLFPQRGSR